MRSIVEAGERRPKVARALRIAALLVLVIAVATAIARRGEIDAGAIEAWVREAGPAGPVLFMGLYALGTVLFLPGSVLTLAGGALFGPVWGTFYNLTGATVGATLAFLVARYLAAGWVERRAGGRTKQLIDGVESEGWRFVAFVRLVPLFPFNLLNYALGLTRIRISHYVVASYLCMLPGAIAYTYVGYAGREALAGGEGLIQKVLIALALLAAAVFLPRIVKRLRGVGAGAEGKLSSADLKQRIERGDDIVVLDVRSVADYNGSLGHIPGSRNIPLKELSGRIPELESRRDRPIAVICRTNRMSGTAVEQLRRAGFKQALLVEDGMVGWQKSQDAATVAAVPCDAGAPVRASTGAGKTVTLIVQNAPYKGDNKAWHALRFAGAALAEDMKVRVHLLDDGAQLVRRGHQVPAGCVDLEKLLAELMEFGLEVRACAMALNECRLDERDLIPGVQPGSMKALASWVKESDAVLTF